jgi:hypothetical protein
MKYLIILATALSASLFSFGANAAGPSAIGTNTPPPQPMVWKCGKNNPAMWGTWGNGCLKQKRKAKKHKLVNPNGQAKLSN